jgi:hypothetical protein
LSRTDGVGESWGLGLRATSEDESVILTTTAVQTLRCRSVSVVGRGRRAAYVLGVQIAVAPVANGQAERFFGIVVNELPFVAYYWLLTSTLL